MKTQKPYSLFDIEPLLSCKPIEQLTKDELAFLKQHIGSIEQIKAYQQMLQLSMRHLDVQKAPEITPAPALQNLLRQRLVAKQTSYSAPTATTKSSFEPFFLFLWNLLTGHNATQPTFVVVAVVLGLWFGTNLETPFMHRNAHSNDSIVLQVSDSLRNSFDHIKGSIIDSSHFLQIDVLADSLCQSFTILKKHIVDGELAYTPAAFWAETLTLSAVMRQS